MTEYRKLLLVEDEDDIRTVAEMALATVGGFEVRTCVHGADALEALEEFPADLIVTDVMMPTMDGPTLLNKLRQIDAPYSELPLIFLTAKAQPEEVQRYRELGALGVVTKPFDPMKLAERIRALLP